MTVFGITQYGTDVYGLSLPPAYLVAPMAATPVDYGTIAVTWKQPSGVMFRYRLLSNRYGFPVDENDGTIIYDQDTYPGSTYVDTSVIPGTYHYYGFYVLVDVADNIWVRSGFAACLAPVDTGAADWLYQNIPEYFRTQSDGSELTATAEGNTELEQFFNVVGWAGDYLRTQYNVLNRHLNDPSFIPLGDLWNMAAEVGLNFNTNIPARTVRKAVANWAHISQNRGTLAGLRSEIQVRTGWDADVQIGPNEVLQNDQAQFLAPVFLPYTASKTYHKDDCIWWPVHGVQILPWRYHDYWFGDGFWYRCLIEGTFGIAPPGNGTNNANWQCIRDTDDFLSTLQTPQTSAPSSWELLDSSAASGIPVQGSLTQGLGVSNPVQSQSSYNAWNSLRFYNHQGSARTLWARSVSRRTSTLGQIPDAGFETGLAVPTPQARWHHWDMRWLPEIWPRILFHCFDQFLQVPEWWSFTNSKLTRVKTPSTHSGLWAGQVAPDPGVLPSATTGQLTDPGFEAGVVGWTYYACNFIQVEGAAHGGTGYGQIVPEAVPSPSITSPSVACTAGAAYTGSLWVQSGSANTVQMQLDLQFLDENEEVIQSFPGAQVPVTSTYVKMTASATAPAGSVSMRIVLAYVSSTPTTAMIINVDDAGFTGPAGGLVGTNQVFVSSPWFKCPANQAVTGSIWVYAPAALSGQVQAQLEFFDQYGRNTATQAGVGVTATVGSWVQVSVSATSPSSCLYGALNIGMQAAIGTDTFLIDDASVSPGLTLNSNWPPEKINAIRDGIPVPFTRPSERYSATRRYITNDIVVYGNQPFIALRASTGVLPPTNNVATAEWAPLSQSPRIRQMVSGYTSQNLTNGSNLSAPVVPFVEWFDQQGNWIARVFARNPNSNGTASRPDQLAFDSFTTQSLSGNGVPGGTVAPSVWVAQYYNNITLSGSPVYQQPVSSLSFNWAGASPAPGVNAAQWSVRYTGSYTAPVTGTYSFTITSQGPSRVFINGQQVINNWVSPVSSPITGTVSLTAGTTVNVEVDYADTSTVHVAPGPPNYVVGWFSEGSAIAESPVVSVVSGAPYHVALDASFHYEFPVEGEFFTALGPPVVATMTIAWYGLNGQPIATTVTETGLGESGFNGDTQFMELDGDVPGGAVSAAVFIRFDQGRQYVSFYGPAEFSATNVVFELGGVGSSVSSVSLSNFSYPASPPSTITVGPGLNGRYTDDALHTWAVTQGAFTCGGFEQGTVWPSNPNARSLAYLTGSANGMLGVTFRTAAASGMTQGMIFRRTDDSNYWRATTTALQKKVAGAVTTLATYAHPFLPNDRMNVEMNGTTITVFRNNVQVAQVTDSFNSTATQHGIVHE